MPKEFSRKARVGEVIQRELAMLIPRELDTRKLGLLTVADVDVSPDLKYAKVFFTSLGSAMSTAEIADYLNGCASLLRHHLSQRLSIRSTPNLRFVHDHSLEQGERIDALLRGKRGDSEEN